MRNKIDKKVCRSHDTNTLLPRKSTLEKERKLITIGLQKNKLMKA